MRVLNLIFLLVCVVCVAANNFGQPKKLAPRIIGGHVAKKGQFPYQVAIRRLQDDQHFCSGAILNSRFILTGAQCTSFMKAVYCIVGTNNRLKGGIRVNIKSIFEHPEFDEKMVLNDIALLYTTEDIPFSKLVKPIALPQKDLPQEANTRAVFSGWGERTFLTRGGPLILPKKLQYLKTLTISHAACLQRYEGNPFQKYIHKNTICTTNPNNVGACYADNGDPLVNLSEPENKYLVGILSTGVPCAQGLPDVSTNVFSHIEWINETMSNVK